PVRRTNRDCNLVSALGKAAGKPDVRWLFGVDGRVGLQQACGHAVDHRIDIGELAGDPRRDRIPKLARPGSGKADPDRQARLWGGCGYRFHESLWANCLAATSTPSSRD